jgi:spore maturation protein CgeB
MRVLVVDTYYPAFLAAHYGDDAALAESSYTEQHAALMARHFGTGDAYARELRARGHDAWTVVANCEPLQLAWARERGAVRATRLRARLPTRIGIAAREGLTGEILDAQVRALDPEIVYLQDLWLVPRAKLDGFRAAGRKVVGQIASEPPPAAVLQGFDMLVTSFPHFGARFEALGVRAELLRIGYDDTVQVALRAAGVDPSPEAERPHAISFVGALNPRTHGRGTRLLEELCRRELPLEVWGYGADSLDPGSPLHDHYRGPAFGLDMHAALARSRIALNRHIDVAEGHANNMRLYEATGDGAALVTDDGIGLDNLFRPREEVLTYRDADDLADVLRSLLEDERWRLAIARAGQERTLREHTYAQRIEELAGMLESLLP